MEVTLALLLSNICWLIVFFIQSSSLKILHKRINIANERIDTVNARIDGNRDAIKKIDTVVSIIWSKLSNR